MTLLEDVQNAAVDASNDLGTLLRKCKLLAARLGSRPLEEWLLWESNGYPQHVPVPDYRIWPLELKGHFSGYFGSVIRNAPIPLSLLPEKSVEYYKQFEFRESIATIEEILSKKETKTMQVSTGDLAIILGQDIYQNQNCIQAWAEFSTLRLVEVENTVRNRILDFVLAVWKEEPTAGDAVGTTDATLEGSRVTQIFNTTIHGGAATHVGPSCESTIVLNITANDLRSLKGVLHERGVKQEDLFELEDALKLDGRPESKAKFGPKVSAWIAKMIHKAADGSWSVGVGAAGNLLAQAITKFYGM